MIHAYFYKEMLYNILGFQKILAYIIELNTLCVI